MILQQYRRKTLMPMMLGYDSSENCDLM